MRPGVTRRRPPFAPRTSTPHPDMRPRQNAAAALIIAFLFLIGFWLYFELRAAIRVELCIEAGFRNCGKTGN